MKLSRVFCFKNFGLIIVAGGLLATNLFSTTAWADDAPAAATAEDAEAKAWDELRVATKPPTRPAEWREHAPSREEQQDFLLKYVDAALTKVGEFLEKYPAGAHVAQAQSQRLSLLKNSVALGSSKHEAALGKIIEARAKDPNTPESERLQARFEQLNLSARRAATTNEDAAMQIMGDGLLELQKDFPKSTQLYAQMMEVAMNAGGDLKTKLARAVADSAAAPEKLKQKAQDILDGKIFDAKASLGKPVDIKFTAVDGTEVELAKLKGRVVLVDFWATWCGPCVAELPHVKEAYAKYHEKGFEIIGISFEGANGKEKLIKFTQDKEMPWPQYYDGKQWENEFGQRFGIRGIPAMWLFDKKGNLADLNARSELAEKVAKLLKAE